MLNIINAVLLVAWIELAEPCARRIGRFWTLASFGLIFLWVIFSSIWGTFKLVPKYGYSFYRKDGKIELKKGKVPIWAWGLYIVTFLGPAILNTTGYMPVRWALTISLSSFGTFIFYISKKHKERPLGVVGGVLVLSAALVIATGLIKPFGGEQWEHSYFVTLMAYIVGSGFVTAVAVHIYNRVILRKIKKMRPFGEQQADKSDS